MGDDEVKILMNKLLESGDIKIYSEEGKLVNLVNPVDNEQKIDEYNNYIKVIEKDFRENADAILEGLELSHLHVHALKDK